MPSPYHKLCDLMNITPKTEPTIVDRTNVLNQALLWAKRMEAAFDAESIAVRKWYMLNQNEKVN